MNALATLATHLRDEETPISPHVVDPPAPGECSLAVESIREGYLLHYGQARLLSGHDPDLGLLAGDYLYALGLDRLARRGDVAAVATLAELIGRCAQLHSEGRDAEAPALWESAVSEIASAQSQTS